MGVNSGLSCALNVCLLLGTCNIIFVVPFPTSFTLFSFDNQNKVMMAKFEPRMTMCWKEQLYHCAMITAHVRISQRQSLNAQFGLLSPAQANPNSNDSFGRNV